MPTVVTLDLDGTAHTVNANLWRIWLQSGDESPIRLDVDPVAKLRWKELDKLPELRELGYQGRDDGVLRYLASRPSITNLMWTGHRCPEVDLRDGHLEQLGIDPVAGRFTVRVPRAGTLRGLGLYAPKQDGELHVVIDDPSEGEKLAVTLFGARASAPVRVKGVPRLDTLRFLFAKEVDLADLGQFRALRQLEIMGEPTCKVVGLERLAALADLRVLILRNCYDLETAKLPTFAELPRLERVDVDGARKETAAVVRERLKGVAKLAMRGVRTAEWLAANLDNPFREWADEYGRAAFGAASKAWKTASRALAALNSRATPAQVKAVLEAFVNAFNVLEAKSGLDTTQVEQVSDAYDVLVARAAETVGKAAPSDAKAREWFERQRSF